MKMNFKDIIIPNKFAETTPSHNKMIKCEASYENGILDRDLVVNGKNILVDGYVLYCVMRDHNYEGEVEVKQADKFDGISTTYVFGKHPGDDKERCWYINMSYNKVKNFIGRTATVQTYQGLQPITITDVKRLSKQPVPGKIRKVEYI